MSKPSKNEYVCADCGTEKNTSQGTCNNCGSVRIVLISMIESLVGPDWRENFEPNPDPVTVDHPDYEAAKRAGRRLQQITETGDSD